MPDIKLVFVVLVCLKNICAYNIEDLYSMFGARACVEGFVGLNIIFFKKLNFTLL